MDSLRVESLKYGAGLRPGLDGRGGRRHVDVDSGLRRLSPHTFQTKENGVGNGNRTRNRRSHSPVLCQLSYSHRRNFIIAIWRGGVGCLALIV
jgi:hypothetical protein